MLCGLFASPQRPRQRQWRDVEQAGHVGDGFAPGFDFPPRMCDLFICQFAPTPNGPPRLRVTPDRAGSSLWRR